MSNILHDNKPTNADIALELQSLRKSLPATVSELATATGIPAARIEAIEGGHGAKVTRAEIAAYRVGVISTAQVMNAVTRPAWATETREPEKPGTFGAHWTTVRVGAAVIRVEQIYDFDGGEYTPEPVFADLTDTEDINHLDSTLCDAQWCRDLAAALLEAARIIESATP